MAQISLLWNWSDHCLCLHPMKTSLALGCCFALSSVASIAHAQPALLVAAPAAAPAPVPAPTSYVQAGVGLAVDQALVGTLTAEGGHRITGPWWAHAMIEDGTAGGVDEPNYGGRYLAARLGVEARGCVLDGMMCAVAGVDAGVRHVDYMAEYDSANTTSAVVVPRVGLDLGTRHLRIRPGIEKNVLATRQIDGLAVTGAVAYQW
jgi:hypothetical protein